MVGCRTNEASRPLTEFQYGFRERVLEERISAPLTDLLETGLNKGMCRHGKRQPRDNHMLQGLSGHIHTHPEAVQTEKHRMDVLAEFLQQLMPLNVHPLDQETDAEILQIT